MTPRSLVPAALLLALLAAALPAAAQTEPDVPPQPADNNGAATAADQEDADLGAAMRAALNKDSSKTNSTAANPNNPNNEVYGPPMPSKTPVDPIVTGGPDTAEGFNQLSADQATARLLASNSGSSGRVGNRSSSLPPPAPTPSSTSPRALATSAKGNGGTASATGAPGPGGPSGAAGSESSAGPSGPTVASAPKGAILDVNNPDQMGETIATFAGLVHEQSKLTLQQQALLKVSQAPASRLPVAPQGARESTTEGEDSWSKPFDGRGDEGTVVPVRDTFRGVPLSKEQQAKGA